MNFIKAIIVLKKKKTEQLKFDFISRVIDKTCSLKIIISISLQHID